VPKILGIGMLLLLGPGGCINQHVMEQRRLEQQNQSELWGRYRDKYGINASICDELMEKILR
jgi:hypothetical protein